MDKWDRLIAIEEIKKLKARYFRCVDTKDFEGFGGVFTPDGVLDLRFSYKAPNFAQPRMDESLPAEEIFTGREAIIALARKAMTPLLSVHHGHMPEIEIDGETSAHGLWAMEDNLWNAPGYPPFYMKGYGHYEETYERLHGAWFIKYCKLTRLYLTQTAAP